MDANFQKNLDPDDTTDEWLTPPDLLERLGPFDLDPTAPEVRPWPTALRHFTKKDDGLKQEWFGRVWYNPPYNKATIRLFLEKMSRYTNYLALLYARVGTKPWFDYVWPRVDSMLIIKGRLHFYKTDGTRAGTAGSDSVILFGDKLNSERLRVSGIEGKFIQVN